MKLTIHSRTLSSGFRGGPEKLRLRPKVRGAFSLLAKLKGLERHAFDRSATRLSGGWTRSDHYEAYAEASQAFACTARLLSRGLAADARFAASS